jgi:hypothetical protein
MMDSPFILLLPFQGEGWDEGRESEFPLILPFSPNEGEGTQDKCGIREMV